MDKTLRQERIKVLKEDTGIWDTEEVLTEEQTEKLENFIYDMLTDNQIDELYFSLL